MRHVLAMVVGGFLLVAVGCQNNDRDMKSNRGAMDACPHCDGVQRLNTDGKCEECGMKMTAGASAATDACAHCPGVQVANADGECPKCGMKVETN